MRILLTLIITSFLLKTAIAQKVELIVNFEQWMMDPSHLKIAEDSLFFTIYYESDSSIAKQYAIQIPEFQRNKTSEIKGFYYSKYDPSVPRSFNADIIDGDTIIVSEAMRVSTHPMTISGYAKFDGEIKIFSIQDPDLRSKSYQMLDFVFDLLYESIDSVEYLARLYGKIDHNINYYKRDETTLVIYGIINTNNKPFEKYIKLYNLISNWKGELTIDMSNVYRIYGTEQGIEMLFNHFNENQVTAILYSQDIVGEKLSQYCSEIILKKTNANTK